MRGEILGRRAWSTVGAILVVAASAPAAAAGAVGGTFTQHPGMNVARDAPALAPLPGGRVLVAGGAAGNGTSLASAEIFDPATNTFTPTGSLITARQNAAAAPLADGRVLVAGGFGAGATAEIFNPATGSFTSVPGDMTVARTGAGAVPLPDGRVLVIGGDDGDDGLNSAEIFNGTNGFTSAGVGAMADARAQTAAVPSPDGRILVLGGNPASDTTEFYDVSAKTFSAGPALVPGGFDRAVAPLPDGRVILAGGFSEESGAFSPVSTAALFDPATGASTVVSGLPEEVEGARASALPDGRVLIAGGLSGGAANKMAVTFSLTPPPARLTFTTKGLSLTVETPVAGTVTVAGISAKRSNLAATAKKRKKKPSRPLGTSSASGGPGPVTVKLKLAGRAKARFKKRGKASVQARILFAPSAKPQECVPMFTQCYSKGFFAGQTETLNLKGKKKKKKGKKGKKG